MYPPSLKEVERLHLITTIKEWSISHGLAVHPSTAFTEADQDGNFAVAAPVTLFPSQFSRACFEEARLLQRDFNELYANISRDEIWLEEVVSGLAKIDDFIAKLWDIHIEVKKEGYAQDLSLGLFRSDYMMHQDPQSPSAPQTLRQVEFNTIASSFGGLSSLVSGLHSYLVATSAYPDIVKISLEDLPTNSSIQSLAAGLNSAHHAYGPSKSISGGQHPLCVLFIVQDSERNIYDQKALEFALLSLKTPSFRLPFSSVLTCTTLSPTRTLLYHPPAFPTRTYEVSTLYFRAGYSPDEYTNADAWAARLHLERSAAIKCPSVLTQLAGTKKVQQILAEPGSPHLARFAPTAAERLRATFAPMYALDAGSDVGRALATGPDASRFVLKPQREGGGNNIYRSKIPVFLKGIGEEKWPAYVLMEMIEPPAQANAILREGQVQSGGVICELGVFGTVLWNGDGVVENKEAGYLMRTKGDKSEEGGVAAGFGAVDSCYLV